MEEIFRLQDAIEECAIKMYKIRTELKLKIQEEYKECNTVCERCKNKSSYDLYEAFLCLKCILYPGRLQSPEWYSENLSEDIKGER